MTKRDALKKEIDDSLAAHLHKYGVLIDDVNVVNITFTEQFTKAVEDKQVAEQKSQQARYEAAKAEQDAYAEINRAKGKAEAQRLLRASIDDNLLKLRAIEKWDGKFPQVMGGGSLPLINIQPDKLTGK